MIRSGKLARDLNLPPVCPHEDRFMICSNQSALADIRAELDSLGFEASPGSGVAGDYVFERAFVEQLLGNERELCCDRSLHPVQVHRLRGDLPR